MSEDALKALLTQAEPAPPVRDTGFVITVMEKVERRRFFAGLARWIIGGTLLTSVMSLIMPSITPALVAFGQDLVPAAFVLAMLSMAGVGAYYLRPALRDFGVRI